MMEILIADDNRMLSNTLNIAVKNRGLEPVMASDGETALHILAEQSPLLALVDWNMPKMSGVELCREIRATYPDRPLYIIIMTAKADRPSLIEAFKAGADDFATKPFKLEEIKARIQTGQRVLRLQNRLTDRKNEIEKLIASISSILVSFDASLTVQHWNRAAELFFGLGATDTIGKTLDELDLSKMEMHIIDAVEQVKQTKQSVRGVEMQIADKEGRLRWLHVNIDPVQIGRGKPGYLLIADDITEQRDLEHQLLNAQKLESIGQLAAGIAHEINTPVQFVSDNAGFLDESFTTLQQTIEFFKQLAVNQNEETRRSIEEKFDDLDIAFILEETPVALSQIHEGLEKIARIVRAMKEFAHPEAAEKKPIDLNRAIETTIIVARNEWKYVSTVETELDPDLPSISCYPGELNQVFLNIIINAAHAIRDVVGDTGELGVITVRSRLDGDWVVIEISDTGGGVPDKIVNRIFDPFFTTKEVGVGTGQGLSISRNVIVEKHGGELSVTSQPGAGATFVIRLPIFEPDKPAG